MYYLVRKTSRLLENQDMRFFVFLGNNPYLSGTSLHFQSLKCYSENVKREGYIYDAGNHTFRLIYQKNI